MELDALKKLILGDLLITKSSRIALFSNNSYANQPNHVKVESNILPKYMLMSQ